MSERARGGDRPPPVDASRARPAPALARSTTTLFSHRFPPRSPPRSPRAIPHDPSRPFIVISTRCRGRSVARVTRMRSRAGAVKRPRASSSRARCAPSDDDDDERGRRGGRRRETPTARRPRRVVRASRGALARHSHIRMSSTRAARARAGTTRGTSIRRVVRRPSSVVVETRRESVKKKNGRSSRTSLAELARSLVRSRARDDVARNDRARRRVSSKSAGPVASLHFFIRARGYRVEACVKSMYVCEWFDTVKKRKKRCRRPVYVQ